MAGKISDLINAGLTITPDGQERIEVAKVVGGVLRTRVCAVGDISTIVASGSFTAAGTGAVVRTMVVKARDFVSVRDYGATGDGVTDDSAAFTLAHTAVGANGSLYVPPGTYVTTVAPILGVTWGAGIVLNAGIRLYLHPYPFFPDVIYADIFGQTVISDGRVQLPGFLTDGLGNPLDAQPALQRAVNFAGSNAIPLLLPKDRQLRLDTTLIVKQGSATGELNSVHIIGNGCILFPSFAGPCLTVQPQAAGAGGSNAVGSFELHDMTFNGGLRNITTGGHSAIRIGMAGRSMDSFKHSIVRGVLCSGFAEPAILVDGAYVRMIVFEDVVIRDGGFLIRSAEPGFVGDMHFSRCQSEGSVTKRPLHLAATVNSSDVRGLRFDNCTFYGSGTFLGASGTGILADIWFTTCQWDGPGSTGWGIQIYSDGSSITGGPSFDDCYIVQYEGGITASTVASASNTGLKINRTSFGTIRGPAIGPYYPVKCESIENVTVSGCTFSNITPGRSIVLDATLRATIVNNYQGEGATDYFVQTIGACDKYLITGNHARVAVAFALDGGSGANKLIANNLSYA